jgi:hypothetical protein
MPNEALLEGLLNILLDRNLNGRSLPTETIIQSSTAGPEIWLRLPEETHCFRRVTGDNQAPAWQYVRLLQ